VIGCRFSSLCLWTSIECAYCATIMLICLNALLIFVIRIFNFVSKNLNDGICVVALAPATRTMSGTTFYPLDAMLLMSGNNR
jgi:hypothetical protein